MFVDFGNEYDFRTFKHDEMLSIRVISFKVIEEEEKENVEEEVEDLGLNELIPEDSFEIGSSNRNLDSGTIYEWKLETEVKETVLCKGCCLQVTPIGTG